MVKKYEYLISSSYVKHWTVYDALREILQNAIDSDAMGYPKKIEYNEEEEELFVHNSGVDLPLSALLLGNTSKPDQSNTIGNFGEGLKLAMLVLLRQGHNVSILTSEKHWVPSVEYSEEFEDDILVVHIDDLVSFDSPTTQIFIDGIRPETWEMFRSKNVSLMEGEYNYIPTSYGEIILDANYSGHIFVGGLYVTAHSDLKYGYNFDPGVLPLDRDRQKIYGFDLLFPMSKMLAEIPEDQASKTLFPLMESEYEDARYLYTQTDMKSINEFISDLWNKFEEQYGKAVPVYSEGAARELKAKRRGIHTVVVPSILNDLLVRSDRYEAALNEFEKIEKITPKMMLMKWYDENSDLFPASLTQTFMKDVIPLSQDWE